MSRSSRMALRASPTACRIDLTQSRQGTKMPPIIWHDLREPTHPSSEAEPRSLVSISLRRSRAVGLTEWRAGLLPHDKFEAIQEMRASGCRVAMVGDGVNDASALAIADVGFAM